MDNSKAIAVNNFKGGYCGNLPISNLQLDQAADLDNIVILPNGQGFRSRLGNSKLNSSVLNSGNPIQGMGILLQANQTLFLVAIAGAKVYKSSNISSTFTDITGSYSAITASGTARWDLFTFLDSIVGFGGQRAAPDAPITWTGSGNIAALGGTAPQAYGGLAANNRVFVFNTTANPSTMYWSIIGDADDFSGSGSGSAVVGSVSDNQMITGATVISTNYMLVFKQNSTYQMIISSAPFPVYSLFSTVGCVGKHAIVNVEGIVYFINAQGDMVSTDGELLTTYDKNADDLFGAINVSNLYLTEGVRQKGVDYDWIVWIFYNDGATPKCIIWDLINKCWLRCNTGYKMYTTLRGLNNAVYLGSSDGWIYLPDQSGIYADASETSPGTIAAYWRSGWINPQVQNEIVQVRKVLATYKTKASGSITFNYGFDFNLDSASATFSQVATGSELYTSRLNLITGRGNFFNFKIGLSSSTIDMNLQSLTLRGKVYGQKRISAA